MARVLLEKISKTYTGPKGERVEAVRFGRDLLECRTQNFDVALASGQHLTAGEAHGRVLWVIAGDAVQAIFRQGVDQPSNARPVDCPGAHRARFATRVEAGTGQF